jgi:hypothetical protein
LIACQGHVEICQEQSAHADVMPIFARERVLTL